jgi:hypothetical protein
MKTRSRFFCSAALASTLALGACTNTALESPVYLGVVISPRPASIPVGGTMVFTGTVSNNLSLPAWSVLDAAIASNVGTLTPDAGSPDAILYTAPATPPIYNSNLTGITQGTITLNAVVTDPPGSSEQVSNDAVTFVITAPSVTVNLTPLTATVSLGTTQQFFAYAVGNLNNTLVWQVNGITGGSTSVGTINTAGTYIAPGTMPMSGNTVKVSIYSAADPAKTASATINLQ